MYQIETVEYKGYNINIYYDESSYSPDDWGDDQRFLVSYHNSFTIKHDDIITQDQARQISNEDYHDKDEKAVCLEIVKKYHIFGLEAYIHSGVVQSLSYEGNFPDRRWDVSQLGLVLISKEEIKTGKKARRMAVGLIDTWNDYLSGNVYGFMIQKDGEESGGCWSFYGDPENSGLIENAKEEIDCELEEEAKKKAKKLKVFIENNVPIDKRIYN